MMSTFTHWASSARQHPYCRNIARPTAVLLLLLLPFGALLKAQAPADLTERVSLDLTHVTLTSLLEDLGRQTKLHLVYVKGDLSGTIIESFHVHNLPLKEALQELRRRVPSLEYTIMPTSIGFRLKGPQKVTEGPVLSGPYVNGRVADAASGAPMTGVTVQVRGYSTTVTTDASGIFRIRVPDENAMLVFTSVGFQRRELRAGAGAELHVLLSVQGKSLGEVVVEARRKVNTESALLNERKNMGVVSDGISAANIAKTASITTTQALQRVQGVTVTDDKYVAIRGLGDRSVIAELNGARLSSADPDRSAVPLDLIPAAFLDNVQVYKTLSPDHPADASAGMIELKTLSIPDTMTLQFTAQGGVNSTIGFGGSFNSFQGSTMGFLGQNVKSHDLSPAFLNLSNQYPGGLQQIQELFIQSRSSPALTAEANRINTVMQSFAPVLTTNYTPAQPNQIYSGMIANTFQVFGGHQLGVLVSGSYYHRTEDRYHAQLNQYNLYQGVVTGSSSIFNPLQLAPNISPSFPRLDKYLGYTENTGTETLNYGLLTSVTYQFSPLHGIQIQYITTRGAEVQGSNLDGSFQNTGLQFPVYNQVNQLKQSYRNFSTVNIQGEDKLWNHPLAPQLSYNLSSSKSSEDDPDFRFTDLADLRVSQFRDANGVGVLSDTYAFIIGTVHGIGPNGVIGADPNGRKYRTLDENNYNAKADLAETFMAGGNKQLIKIGYNYLRRDRTFTENILGLPGTNLGGDDGLLNQSKGNLNELVSYNNIGLQLPTATTQEGQPPVGGFLYQIKKSPDNYTGNYGTQAIYAMADLRLSSKLRLLGGVRFETTDIHAHVDTNNVYNPLANIQALNNNPGESQALTGSSTSTPNTQLVTGFKPYYSGNLIYNWKSDMNFRLAYSTSLARPELRELTNIYEFDPFQFAVVVGNPALVNQLTRSADFRWEWFTGRGEVFSASVFGKLIDHQLNKVFIYNSQGNQSQYPEFPIVEFQNDPNQGKVYGIELEARKDLGRVWEPLKHFSIGANLMLAQSEVVKNPQRLDADRINDRRSPTTSPLFEQAPYSVNTYLDYDNPKWGSSFTTSFNMVGERLIQVQLDGSPDIYDRPVPVLDFVFSQRLNKHFLLKGFAKNILNPPYRQVYADPGNNGQYHGITYLRQEYYRGTEYALGLTYNIF
jgi:TonB-dependent receptor